MLNKLRKDKPDQIAEIAPIGIGLPKKPAAH